mmetsp:Transcript_8001/g.17565  ORF Transcript_8001/g.17565 Transcript_8001/m.17565 type:complete len:330 (-) Transcript_8001:200-1189(-)
MLSQASFTLRPSSPAEQGTAGATIGNMYGQLAPCHAWTRYGRNKKGLFSGGVAVGAILEAVNLVRKLWRGERTRHSPRARFLERERAGLDTHVAVLAPVLAPRIAHEPVKALSPVSPPADDGDNVVSAERALRGDARGVVDNRLSIDSARNGATRIDLLLHGGGTRDVAVVGDGCIREVGEPNALLAEGAARARHVQCVAGPITVWADALAALRRTRHVRVAGGVGNTGARLALLGHPLVRAVQRAAVAGANVGTVEDVLDRQLDVNALAATRNLDAVGKRRDGAMRPARAAILRNVLIQRWRAVVDAVLVAPGEVIRVGCLSLEVLVR